MAYSSQDMALTEAVQHHARPLDSTADLDALMDRIGDSRFVLLGEASHGTSEFYTWRMRISQRLIEEKGFSFIAVEGDWPACYQVNRYVRGYIDGGTRAPDVLAGFDRWPTWMWANWEVAALAEWMRSFNANRPVEKQVGFYGLDVYSLWESLDEISRYLEARDPEEARLARQAYQCFEPYNRDEQQYAWATRLVSESCEADVMDLLMQLRSNARGYAQKPGDGDEAFNAEQNALVAVGAERYYRTMIVGGPASWNIRDTHMADTLDRLMNHLGPSAKAIVWEHNTHIGDARATDMAGAGMVNVGQLVRERHEAEGVVLVGFGSHRGTVIAGREWGAPMEEMPVPEARADSWEDVMHRALQGRNGLFILNGLGGSEEIFRRTRGHRAIGVVYDPNYERMGNYVPTSLSRRYDAFIHVDLTQALHPLPVEEAETVEPPELYPWNV